MGRGKRGGGKKGKGERWGRGGIWEGSWQLATEGASEDSLTWGSSGLVPIPDKRLKREKTCHRPIWTSWRHFARIQSVYAQNESDSAQ